MVLHDLNLAAKYSDFLVAMKEGEIFRYGTVEEVMKEDTLKECFGIRGVIGEDAYTHKPICVSYELLEKK